MTKKLDQIITKVLSFIAETKHSKGIISVSSEFLQLK